MTIYDLNWAVKVSNGHIYKCASCVVKLGGNPIEAIAAMCDKDKWISTELGIEEWLTDRGLPVDEAKKLILEAIRRNKSCPNLPKV